MKIKTSELEGAALDWAVAKVSGAELDIIDMPSGPYIGLKGGTHDGFPTQYSPSTLWGQGGPLIDRLEMLTRSNGIWFAISICDEVIELSGPTPLIAAMRAIVAAELGDEIDVPEELL